MKDYSKVKFVKADVEIPDESARYLTRGKVYPFRFVFGEGGHIFDDVGDELFLHLPNCSHLNDQAWTPCNEDGEEVAL